MTVAASVAFPGSRTLAGWWRQLAPFQPTGLWVGYLFVHRVEALVAGSRPRRVDPLFRLVLTALELASTAGGSGDVLDRLNSHLHLGRPLLRRVLRALTAEDLVHENGAGWSLTPRGRHGRLHEEYPAQVVERRTFSFLERLDAGGARAGLPHLVPLRRGPANLWVADEVFGFDPALLRSCLEQPETWKRRFGFPLDVDQLLDAAAHDVPANTQTPAEWQRVIVDQPERLLAAFARRGDDSVYVFAARQEGWSLSTPEPVLAMTEDWRELVPPLAQPLGMDSWLRAWMAWGQQRGLPADELEGCDLSLGESCLRVRPPPALVTRLRSARSDVLKGDTWLLAGEGWIRAAARVQLEV